MGGAGIPILHVVLEESGGGFEGDVVVEVDLHLGVESIEAQEFADPEDDLLDPGVDGAHKGEGLLACGHSHLDLDVVIFYLFHWKI